MTFPRIHHQHTISGSEPLEMVQLYVQTSRMHYPDHAAKLADLGLFDPFNQLIAAGALATEIAADPVAHDIVIARHGEEMTGFAIGCRLQENAYAINYLCSSNPADDRDLLAEIMTHAPKGPARVTAVAFKENALPYKEYGCAIAHRPARVRHAASRTATGEGFHANETVQNSLMRLVMLSDDDMFGWVYAVRCVDRNHFTRSRKPV